MHYVHTSFLRYTPCNSNYYYPLDIHDNQRQKRKIVELDNDLDLPLYNNDENLLKQNNIYDDKQQESNTQLEESQKKPVIIDVIEFKTFSSIFDLDLDLNYNLGH